MTKRILIVGYRFVDASMGGVRLRRISRLLPRYGWEPVVLTPPRLDDSVALPEKVRREEVPALDLTRLYAKLRGAGRPGSAPANCKEPAAKAIGLTSRINRWLMVPDKQVTWYRAAVRRGRQLLRSEKFDAIFASQDPRTCLLVAARLSRESGVPCVLEYRDLWTGNPYYHITQPTALHRWLHERLERKVLRQARRVSAVCRGIADYLSQKHAAILQAPVELNYNFFDPEEYPPPWNERSAEFHFGAADGSNTIAPKWNSVLRPFIVSYTGSMYGDRDPSRLFRGPPRLR